MAVFPTLPGLAWKVGKSPRFKTRRYEADAGQETRVAGWSYPRWEFDLRWEVLEDDRTVPINQMPSAPKDAFRQLLGFFLARRGSFEPFWFLDPTDCAISSASDGVRQTIAVGDGSRQTFAVPRSFAGQFVEPVGAINTMDLFVNGVFQVTPSYAINNPYDGWILIGTPPPNGHVIKWGGTYYFKVTFERDESQFDQFMADLYENRGIRLRSVKP